jgi:hypothetical protein
VARFFSSSGRATYTIVARIFIVVAMSGVPLSDRLTSGRDDLQTIVALGIRCLNFVDAQFGAARLRLIVMMPPNVRFFDSNGLQHSDSRSPLLVIKMKNRTIRLTS